MAARLTAFKDNIKSALSLPLDGLKTRSKRQVISFNEALENLKTSQTGSVTCGAFNSFGRCRKQITLDDPKLLASLDQFNINDVQTPIKLMPLMLCSSHWGKTVYTNALFLDWLSVHGSNREDIHVENIVIDYQSAIVIDNGEIASSETNSLAGPADENQVRPVSAPNIRTEDSNLPSVPGTVHQPQKDGDADESSPAVTDHGVTSQVPAPKDGDSEELSPTVIDSGVPAEVPSPKDGGSDGLKLIETDSGRKAHILPRKSVAASMDSYASIDLGVVKLEILYQKHLTCIAMTSNGWRCSTIIHQEQVLKARGLLGSSAASGSELDVQLLPRLVICSEHALGGLPQIYSEKWTTFLEQRLRKDETTSSSDAYSRVFAQFLSNDRVEAFAFRPKPADRPTSAVPLSAHGKGIFRFGSSENVRASSSKAHSGVQLESQRAKVENPLGSVPVLKVAEPKDTKTDPNTSSPRFEAIFNPSIPLDQNKTAQVSPPQEIATLSSSQSINKQLEPSDPVDVVNQTLIKEMSQRIYQQGYVHIVKSRDSKLIKLAATRMGRQESESQYQIKGSDEVHVSSLPTAHPERAMRLAHLELQNFRAKQNGKGSHPTGNNNEAIEQEQGEWFKVPEIVAILSVCVWCDFANHAYNPDGTIKKTWAKRLTLLPEPSSNEISLLEKALRDESVADRVDPNVAAYHKERYQRYGAWVRESLTKDHDAPPVR